MVVEVDDRSGFCFGVVNAISKAEQALTNGTGVAEDVPGSKGGGAKGGGAKGGLVSLGDIVHNGAEMARLEALGLEVAPEETDLASLAGRTVLIRAHGEPPETYARAREYGITLIDATCRVVARLQKTVAAAHAEMVRKGGQVVIFGRRGHAEVRGLAGHANGRKSDGEAGMRESGLRESGGEIVVIENEADLDALDFTRPICLLAQTTSSLAEFRRLSERIKRRMEIATGDSSPDRDPPPLRILDTICRRVAGREEHLAECARRFDAVRFVAGAKSSNGRVLFEAVRAANPRSHKIENTDDLRPEWFEGAASVGVCGATSTPRWLMNEVAEAIENISHTEPRQCDPAVGEG
jgi:4-hydroxy-3-methylbut-2-enyl diphosphate reductase